MGKSEKGVDAFGCKQVRLLLGGFGYENHACPARMLERMTVATLFSSLTTPPSASRRTAA